MGEHTFKDKRQAYENSIREPMIIRYPELIKEGSEVNEQCLNIDLAPTILDLAGINIPDYMQGESMLDLIFRIPSFESILGSYFHLFSMKT